MMASAVEIGAGAGDDRHAAIGFLDADLDHAHVLFMGQGRRLAGGAAGHQAVAALRDLPAISLRNAASSTLPSRKGGDEGRN
ncbi:MAG: hypothetical protein WDN08_16185 [Rhizomicrobium sp.]